LAAFESRIVFIYSLLLSKVYERLSCDIFNDSAHNQWLQDFL